MVRFGPGDHRLIRVNTRDAVSACAPGRVELLGNHTDYNGGVVLGAAINRVICVSGIRDDRAIRIRSGGFGEVETDVANLRPLGDAGWANYILGVAAELRQLDVPIRGFVADVRGDLPIRSGLSSSAALELATALLLLKLFPFELPRLEIAKACQRAEHRYVGVQSGLLDQVISLFGRTQHAVFFDCCTEDIRTVPLPSSLALIIADSGRQRELGSGKYNLRRTETQNAAHAFGVGTLRDLKPAQLNDRENIPDLLRRRARHIVEENDRVGRAVELLLAGDGRGFGKLMNESHESSRHNFENSTRELDLLVSIAQQLPGVLGARLTGAGFGGATVTLCERNAAAVVAEQLAKAYAAQTGIKPQVFACEIADGAR
jgi:galactokinase